MRFPKTLKLAVLGTTLVALPLASCEDMLDTEPTTELSPEVVLANVSGAEALLVSMYSRFHGNGHFGRELFVMGDIQADAMIQAPSSQRLAGNFNMTSTFAYYNYSTINEANYIISRIDELEAPQATKNRILGEAYFMRGLVNHLMVRTLAYEPNRAVNGWDRGIILRETPTAGLTDADFRPRSSVTEVYQLIESDLRSAMDLLQGSSNGVYRANYAAAAGMLARVYLYWERWADAESYASTAIAATGATLTTTATAYEAAWSTSPNPESVFELNVNPNTESVGVNESAPSLLSPRQWFDYFTNPDLIALFSENDTRSTLIRVGTKQNIQGYYLDKWNANKGNFAQNLPVMRVAELYLIRAEARARQNKVSEAVADLNTLRSARNVPAVSAGSGNEVVNLVLAERRIELAYEGHRFYDMKRLGMAIPRSAASNLQPIEYDNFRILGAWPSSQVDLNPLLEQNPGY